MADFERILENLRLKSEAFKAMYPTPPREVIKYECWICQDREIVPVEKEDGSFSAMNCSCKERKIQKRLFKSSGLTEEQSKMKLMDFETSEDTMVMYNMAKMYIENQSWIENKGFALVGSVGVGKTMIAQIIANKILADRTKSVIFLPTTSLMAELRVAQFSDGGAEYEQRIARLVNSDVVIFDDVGKERQTEWVQAQYFRIIDGRYNRRKTTAFTSNYDFQELGDRFPEFGEAIISRLVSMTRGCCVNINARDYRLGGISNIIPEWNEREERAKFIANYYSERK